MRETRDIIYIIRAKLFHILLGKNFWLDYKLIWSDTVVVRFHKYIGCKYGKHSFTKGFDGDYSCVKCWKEITKDEYKAYERDNKLKDLNI